MALSSFAPLGVMALGLMLGIRHATDTDHLIAVIAIVSRERKVSVAAQIGLAWGLGHALTVMLVGTAIIFFKISIPARLGLMFEFAVALVLIALGFPALRRLLAALARPLGIDELGARRSFAGHSYPKLPFGSSVFHESAYIAGENPAEDGEQSHGEHLRPMMVHAAGQPNLLIKAFAVGLAHGLAGGAAIALLILSAIPNTAWAVSYLAVFGAGTILGMVLITTALGVPFVLAPARMAGLNHALTIGSGLLSFGFGLFLAYHIGVTNQLFGSAPLWIPR